MIQLKHYEIIFSDNSRVNETGQVCMLLTKMFFYVIDDKGSFCFYFLDMMGEGLNFWSWLVKQVKSAKNYYGYNLVKSLLPAIPKIKFKLKLYGHLVFLL